MGRAARGAFEVLLCAVRPASTCNQPFVCACPAFGEKDCCAKGLLFCSLLCVFPFFLCLASLLGTAVPSQLRVLCPRKHVHDITNEYERCLIS